MSRGFKAPRILIPETLWGHRAAYLYMHWDTGQQFGGEISSTQGAEVGRPSIHVDGDGEMLRLWGDRDRRGSSEAPSPLLLRDHAASGAFLSQTQATPGSEGPIALCHGCSCK